MSRIDLFYCLFNLDPRRNPGPARKRPQYRCRKEQLQRRISRFRSMVGKGWQRSIQLAFENGFGIFCAFFGRCDVRMTKGSFPGRKRWLLHVASYFLSRRPHHWRDDFWSVTSVAHGVRAHKFELRHLKSLNFGSPFCREKKGCKGPRQLILFGRQSSNARNSLFWPKAIQSFDQTHVREFSDGSVHLSQSQDSHAKYQLFIWLLGVCFLRWVSP